MALAGRFGEDAERYLRRHPTAGALFRKLSETNAPEVADSAGPEPEPEPGVV